MTVCGVQRQVGGGDGAALQRGTLSGRMVSLPSFVRAPDTTRGDSASFFALGVFSGLASSCCAPVLVGRRVDVGMLVLASQ